MKMWSSSTLPYSMDNKSLQYPTKYSFDASSMCAGYLETMQHFRTFFFSNFYCHIMSHVEEVNAKIQCPHIGVTQVESKLSHLINILEEKQEGCEQFWQKCLEEKSSHVEEPHIPRRRCIPKRLENPCATEPHIFFTPKDYFRQEYVCVCDTAIWCVKDRFNCTVFQNLESVEKECVSVVTVVNNTTPKLEKT
ncbi:hypothetical protein PR048_018703 [Dryococelus australis]|uniref:Uncharacterized protein n=1 Tax=Dryococelus australis TaxID=614101 RepID=A0ABQ9HD60_9NEOP|nr:hypothetical protein PR048_018703 [Dryococelus australis]